MLQFFDCVDNISDRYHDYFFFAFALSNVVSCSNDLSVGFFLFNFLLLSVLSCTAIKKNCYIEPLHAKQHFLNQNIRKIQHSDCVRW